MDAMKRTEPSETEKDDKILHQLGLYLFSTPRNWSKTRPLVE